ncbi:MAG: glutamate--tRNA ligase [Alphaproteobacteria bacterium]|nr:glutamate--tRNA ligase [Alphaproteobacteria bacterium]
MTVVTRFAPSPTGYLHIGGARTALFNWLHARHHGGTFRLRIEDTDRQRSTDDAIRAILDGLKWLGLDWDDEVVYQFSRAPRHAEVAKQMLARGRAYHCYCSTDELQAMREAQKAAGQPIRYDGRWRDRPASDAPSGIPPVIRLKAPQSGETTVEDDVQGRVTVQNAQLDDLVLLRADGTPTYLLAVVVDDHDMGVTQVIRGDDHLTNTFRQLQIYHAMDWAPPRFAHIPLIHGPDGAKLSKRHGAVGLEAYRDMGYLPEAMRNYLLRLGWAHGDDEIISTAQAIEWFGLEAVGRSPARFDAAKLDHLNGHYLREASDERLASLVLDYLRATLGDAMAPATPDRLKAGMAGLKARTKTLKELAVQAAPYARLRPIAIDPKAASQLSAEAKAVLSRLGAALRNIESWTAPAIEAAARSFAEASGAKLGAVAQPLRAALTGSTVSPPVFEVAAVLGRAECMGRIEDAIARAA